MINFPIAKINLETVFYPVKINDVLEVIKADALTFEASGLGIPGRVEDNLCIKAYHLMAKDHKLPPVSIHLHKHIPIGAGLGGGSADAGYFIRLINQTFDLRLSIGDMSNYARTLGADCAFFIESVPVFAFDKGDQFEPISLDLSKYHIALIMPPTHVSTAEAYRGVKPAPVKQSLKQLIQLPVAEWKHHIKNDFEDHIFKAHPEIRGVKAALYQAGALYASMSGSGASVFGIFENKPDLGFLEEDNEVFYEV